MPAYRIAFVNPYLTAAEVQAFASLRAAAAELGITLEHKAPKDIREDDDYDFLIPVAFTVRGTSHPSFLSCHSPRAVYVDNAEMFGAIASHDGYLTISDNLKSFFRYLSAAMDRPLTYTGDYYNCPQRLDLACDVEALGARGGLELCYFGINWDMRAEPLFRALADRPYMRIYGPEDSWRTIRPTAYKGQTAFDGRSVQAEYAKYGVGLICLGYEHLMDDIVSNRVFEISSVGAAAISPDTPWMRRNFGDAVLYYEPFGSIESIVGQIDEAFEAIRADPKAAQARALKARAIFEERFDAAAMLKGAVTFYGAWKAAAQAQAEPFDEAAVDVIVLDGAGDLAETAASLKRQRAGRYRLLSAGPKTDVKPGGRLAEVLVFDGVTEGERLAAALAAVKAPVFAVCYAGDVFLADHFLRLLPTAQAGRLAYADTLKEHPETPGERVLDRQGAVAAPLESALDRLATACVLAPSTPLASIRYEHWDVAEGATRLLVSALLAYAKAEHRPGPTVVLAVPDSPPVADLETGIKLAMAIGFDRAAAEARLPAVAPEGVLSLLAPAVAEITEAKLDRIAPERVFEGGMVGRDVSRRSEIVYVDVPLTLDRTASPITLDRGEGVVRVSPSQPFEISLRIDIGDHIVADVPPSAVFHLERAEETFFLGMTDASGEIIARTLSPRSRKPLQVWVNNAFGKRPAEAMLQAWKRIPEQPLALTRLSLAYRLEELRVALGRPELTADEVQDYVRRQVRTEVVGAPPLDPGVDREIDFRSPRESYPHFLSDLSFAQGGARLLHVGEAPWGYFGQAFLPAAALKGVRALRCDLADVREPITALIRDEAGAVVSGPIEARGGKDATALWLAVPPERGDLFLVLQASHAPRNTTLKLERISLVA